MITGPGSSILDFGHEARLVSDNLFLALVARDQHCRWPGCTIRATWCDAHHITEWADGGKTNEETCALMCNRHHTVTHQPGWTIIGNGHEFTIHHPDGSIETSRPPTVRVASSPGPAATTTTAASATPTSAPHHGTHDPPSGEPLRADQIGGPNPVEPARLHQQLSLVG